MKPNNAAQRGRAMLIGKLWRRIGPGELEMTAALVANVCMLGFISLSPTYLDRSIKRVVNRLASACSRRIRQAE